MKKRALLCGINRYQIPGSDLRGCVNDVQNMSKLLKELFDFETRDVQVLVDLDATSANIKAGLQTLLDGSAAGDVLYFHFSGHGSNVPDDNGDEVNDARDEIFCPTDLDWYDPLRDDWIRTLFDTLPEGVNLTAITDCCHSGSITRNITPPDAPVKQRYLASPVDLQVTESGRNIKGPRRNGRGREVARPHQDITEIDLPEVLISGCRADQTSADAFIGDQFCGAMSNALEATLRTGRRQMSYRDLHTAMLRQLKKGKYDQVPQLEGAATRLDNVFLAPIV